MDIDTLTKYRDTLNSFLGDYREFIRSTVRSTYRSTYYHQEDGTKLQQKANLVTRIVLLVHGDISLTLTDKTTTNFSGALKYSLSQTAGDSKDFIEKYIILTLNESIGNINNDTIPRRTVKPIIPIRDLVLSDRCLDLLSEPGQGKFDRVIRESTTILEDRLKGMVSHDKLSTLIPKTADLTLEKLINHLLTADNPVISVSKEKKDRIAFQRMMSGISAYLRNPFHHSLNDTTEWSLAWSVVGLIDSLLFELSQSEVLDVSTDNFKNKETE